MSAAYAGSLSHRGRDLARLVELRDATHVCSWTEREWRDMIGEAGLKVLYTEFHRRSEAMDTWLDRAGVDYDTSRRIHAVLSRASERARGYFQLQFDGAKATRI